jgi:predicted DNA-binding transcriptional regulator YafY
MGEVISARGPRVKLVLGGQDWITPLHEALQRQERIEMDYYSMSRGALTTRQVDPYHLTYFEGGFYLIGHCHLRREPRTFAVERIRALRPTGLTFIRPKAFDAEGYFRDSWGIIRGDRLTVRLRFSQGQAKYIAERVWHPSQEFRWVSDGRLELILKVADTLELKRWVLSYGPEVEVLEPASLREEIRKEAEAVARTLAPGRRPPVAVSSSVTDQRYKRREWTSRSP